MVRVDGAGEAKVTARWTVGCERVSVGTDLLLLAPFGPAVLEPDLEGGKERQLCYYMFQYNEVDGW